MPQSITSRHLRLIVHLAIGSLAAILVVAQGCERTGRVHPGQTDMAVPTPAGQSSAPVQRPLLLDDEPLLLLDEEPTTTPPDQPAADNSRCFVCHANYLDEKIAVTHARTGIGCATCHGASDAHIADESWASGGNGTAPDIIFPKERINPSCMACHPKDKIDTTEHKPLFSDDAQQRLCTDCHGSHRLPIRRSKWK